jgi:DNA-binding response OmpR family regulator
MLTAKGDEADQLIGLNIGADDYLPKPCSPKLLVARLRAILRRIEPAAMDTQMSLTVGNICIDLSTRAITVGGECIEFTNSEYNILCCLMKEVGKIVPKEALSEQGLNRKIAAFDRSVDMHISHLRSKLDLICADAPKIRTIRGIGYLLEK